MQQTCTLDLGKTTLTGKALPKSNSSPQKCQRRGNVKQYNYKPPGVHQYRKQTKTTTVKVTTVSLDIRSIIKCH